MSEGLKQRIAELRRLDKERTPGPWESWGFGADEREDCETYMFGPRSAPASDCIGECYPARHGGKVQGKADAKYLAHAANLAPELADEVERLERELEFERDPSGVRMREGHNHNCNRVQYPRALFPCSCGRDMSEGENEV